MAGIGFRLRKLLKKDTYTDLLQAYMYSAIITSGPMIFVIISLGLAKLFVQSQLGIEDASLFQGIIIYVFAYSFIIVGTVVYVLTRYLADRFFLGEHHAFVPMFLYSLLITFVIQSIICHTFLYFTDIRGELRWIIHGFYLIMSGVWIAMTVLSAAKSYMWIVAAFCSGMLVSIAASFQLAHWGELEGALFGYTLGHAVTFGILIARIFLEYGYTRAQDTGVLRYIAKFPYLLLTGLFYHLGVWIDKLVFWYSSYAEQITGPMLIFPDYDSPMFISFLSIVPSMAFFLVRMETSFAEHYQSYYHYVRNRGSLAQIRECKQRIMDNLSENFETFALYQGIFSGVCILLVVPIAELIGMESAQVGILRIGILGSYLLMAVLMIINILFYFDFQRETVLVSGVFCITNWIFTVITMHLGWGAFGFGFTLSCLVSLIVAVIILNVRVGELEYWTFMTQPVLKPHFKLESEIQSDQKKIAG